MLASTTTCKTSNNNNNNSCSYSNRCDGSKGRYHQCDNSSLPRRIVPSNLPSILCVQQQQQQQQQQQRRRINVTTASSSSPSSAIEQQHPQTKRFPQLPSNYSNRYQDQQQQPFYSNSNSNSNSQFIGRRIGSYVSCATTTATTNDIQQRMIRRIIRTLMIVVVAVLSSVEWQQRTIHPAIVVVVCAIESVKPSSSSSLATRARAIPSIFSTARRTKTTTLAMIVSSQHHHSSTGTKSSTTATTATTSCTYNTNNNNNKYGGLSKRMITQQTLYHHHHRQQRSISSSSFAFVRYMSSSSSSPSTSEDDKLNGAVSSSSSTSSDEKEWEAVLAAFQMYVAAYGDLKVPQRFIVPNLPPWPQKSWGLKLGKVVSAIRLTGRYITSSSSSNTTPQQSQLRKQLLDDMGFVWSVRRSSNDDFDDNDNNVLERNGNRASAATTGTGTSSSSSGDGSTTSNGQTRTPKSFPSSATATTTSTTSNNKAGTTNSGIRLEQIITATELYKTITGNTVDTISENFVVPDTNNWPEMVRGLPLGRQLELIKRSKNIAIRNKFASLGVPMDPLPPNAANTAATVSTNATPDSYDIKNQDPTEERGSTIDSSPERKNLSMNPTDIAKALEMAWDGYPDGPSANDIRFQNVYTALVTYMKLYDDLLVPQPFVVPKDPAWPEEIWGLRLGARVNAIRSQGTFVNNNPARRQLLNDIGFVWYPPKERRRGRKTKDELVAAPLSPSSDSSSNNNMLDDTTMSFNNDEMSEGSENDSSNDMSMLFDGTFDFGKDYDLDGNGDTSTSGTTPSLTWNLDSARMPDSNMMGGSTSSMDLKDNTNIDEYKPPRSWAESLAEATQRALDVGIIEGLTPTKRVIKGKREKNIPWFNDDFGGDFVFEDVVEALTIYKSIYGNFDDLTDKSNFIVPARKEVTGFLDMDNIGPSSDVDASVRAAAAIAKFKEQSPMDRSSPDLIAAEINRLQQQQDEDQSMESKSRSAVMAAGLYADHWPEHLAGMCLGRIVTRICDGSLEVKHLPERKAQLDAIGFDWGDPKYFIDIPFEKAVCAMYAYYLVRGDLFVEEDFTMPDEDPWPQALAGYEIGKAVKRLRELQNFLEAYHVEKVGLLRMIDFVWFADTMALPLDSNEKEMDSETLLLCAMGHPDYAKMIDIPMGLPDKIVADGPFYETDDDPKLWWRKWHNWEYVKDYWYQQGRRDNAYALRKMGYPRMGDEHEAKYGPGLFTQMDKVMTDLDNGILDSMGPEGKKDILEKLNYYRQEMLGCTDIHPQDRDKLLSELDTQMLLIMKSASMDISIADDMDSTAYKQQQEQLEKQYREQEEELSSLGVERKRTVLNRLLSNDDDFNEDNIDETSMLKDEDDGNNKYANDDEEEADDGLIEEEFDVEDELGLGGDEGDKW